MYEDMFYLVVVIANPTDCKHLEGMTWHFFTSWAIYNQNQPIYRILLVCDDWLVYFLTKIKLTKILVYMYIVLSIYIEFK